MPIERVKNSNIIVLAKVPTQINSVQGKRAGSTFFSNIKFTLTGSTVTADRTYEEIKVDYKDGTEIQYAAKISKEDFNSTLGNLGAANPVTLFNDIAKGVQSKRISTDGSKATDVNQTIAGMFTLAATTIQNQKISDEPVPAIVTDKVPNVKTTENSTQKSNIETLTGSTAADGLLNATVTTANSKGIQAALTQVFQVAESKITEALQESSPTPTKVVAASKEDYTETISNGAQDVIKKVTRALNNPPGSTNTFGPLGSSFANILGAVASKIKGSELSSTVGKATSGLSPGFIVPAGQVPPVDIINEDGSTNLSGTVDVSQKTSRNIKSSQPVYKMTTAASGWNGFGVDVTTYPFEVVGTTEELELELRSTTRTLTTAQIWWTKTHSDSPLNAGHVHRLHLSEQAKRLDGDLLALSRLGPTAGLGFHYIIRKDGAIQRGRPLSLESDSMMGFVTNTVHVGFVAGYSVPFGTPNNELYLGAESITPAQWKAFDQFLEAWYRAYPGGEAIGRSEISSAHVGPGFDVSTYVAGKYNKSTVYKKPMGHPSAYSPEEQISQKPVAVSKTSNSTIGAQPNPSTLSQADVNTTPTEAENAAHIDLYEKTNTRMKSIQREIDSIVLEQEKDPTSFGDAADRIADLQSELNTNKIKAELIRKDLINSGYEYSNNTWSLTNG